MARPALTRRAVLGLLAAAGFGPTALAMGQTPPRPGRVAIVEGRILLDGQPLIAGDVMPPTGTLETGPGTKAVLAIGEDAFLLRENTELRLDGEARADGPFVSAMTLVSGAVLSVFGPKAITIDTPVASIGIRGTGIYLETDGTDGYACLCYGKADIAVKGVDARESLATKYHDAPRWIRPGAGAEAALLPAPVRNHTDAELILLESLVERTPPFGGKPGLY